MRLWVTAGSAAMLVFFCVLTFVQPTTRAVRAILVALGAAITWASFGGGSSSASAERRALEQRATELAVRTLAPGSPLACLDALAGENVEIACEKDISASRASVATATSYVAARLALLSDITAYTGRGGDAVDALLPLRRALEADRFGFLAHVLVMPECSAGGSAEGVGAGGAPGAGAGIQGRRQPVVIAEAGGNVRVGGCPAWRDPAAVVQRRVRPSLFPRSTVKPDDVAAEPRCPPRASGGCLRRWRRTRIASMRTAPRSRTTSSSSPGSSPHAASDGASRSR